MRGLATVAVLFVVSVAALPAQQEEPGGTADWQQRLVAIGDLLNEGRWYTAEQEAGGLSRAMAEQIVGGAGADLLLGVATTYRAVALAGQGREAEAIWQWQVAQQLFPGVAQVELARFGPEAAALAGYRPRRPASGSGEQARPGQFEPPRRLDSPAPAFPPGRAFAGLKVDIVVQVIIGVDGRPRSPLILDSRGEVTLVWAALEALSTWTFEPATRDGVPEDALYKLTVSFVVPESD
jgi:protein TonB